MANKPSNWPAPSPPSSSNSSSEEGPTMWGLLLVCLTAPEHGQGRAPHEEAPSGSAASYVKPMHAHSPPSTPRNSPRRRLRHGIRAHPLPPAGFIKKNFCKSGLPQNHRPRPRPIKDPQVVEDLQRRIIFAGFYSLVRHGTVREII